MPFLPTIFSLLEMLRWSQGLSRSRLEMLPCRTHIMDAYEHGHHAMRVNVSTSCCSSIVEGVPSAAADEPQVYDA